ncbi:MAG: hypothetical protein IT425_13100 [Pirellulales bacterium]|nr:hypothetical protein [Pirellulales bacterium]
MHEHLAWHVPVDCVQVGAITRCPPFARAAILSVSREFGSLANQEDKDFNDHPNDERNACSKNARHMASEVTKTRPTALPRPAATEGPTPQTYR